MKSVPMEYIRVIMTICYQQDKKIELKIVMHFKLKVCIEVKCLVQEIV